MENTKEKKTITCQCGKDVQLRLVGGQYQHSYSGTCGKCGITWRLQSVPEEGKSNIA